MKYTNKFEEMIDARNQAIANLKKVVNEQNELCTYLSKDEEGKEKFKKLIESLNKEIKSNQEKIIKYGEDNANTMILIQKLKRTDTETLKLVEDVIKEIGIFENSMQEEEKPQPKDESEKDK